MPEIPPEKLPPEVRAFVELLHLNVVNEPMKILPPGFKAPVWLIPVLDEATGETVGILSAYPPYERERYEVITITNKLGRPVTVITFREEAERVSPKPKPKEVEEALEAVKREIPPKPVSAPIDWGYMRGLVQRIKSWLSSMERHVETRTALPIYTYLRSINELLAEARDRLVAGSELIAKHEARKAEPKVLKDEEYEQLWREFSEKLKAEGIEPEKHRKRFDALVAWNMPKEENRIILMDEARKIILEKKLAKYLKKIPEKPMEFSWRYVEWGLGSLRVDTLALEDAVKNEDALQTHTTILRLLETAEKLKALLKLHPEVKAFHPD